MSASACKPPADLTPEAGPEQDSGRRRPALSPSRAIDFKQCPLKYRLRAIDRIPERPSRGAVRGTVVHAVLEDLYGLPADQRRPERAAALIEPAWARVLEGRPEVAELVVADGIEPLLAEVRQLLDSYYRLEDPTGFEPESREARVEVELGNGVLLRGFVDRIDVAPTGELRVVDYKSGRAPGLAQETKALFQLKFYALVVLRTRGILPAQLRLIYLADEQILTYAPDAEELARFERTLGALWEAILEAGRTGEFQPTTSWLCGYCDYKPLCPAFGGTPPAYPGWPADAPESPEETFADAVAD
ncbi:RecB family exonuclease [Nocardia goodfellowii]|uniref:RecB family exonuclease n=1 Tax=Nocardia goodfellowii TaxID=882446 RepID=A0ABS4QH81_9NOCA|nr:RecB family exonuclease [Nocardia goodfellowii]MBP2190948.1 putative RecB family exonuclease [Nocardia goodfellowii]